METKELTLKELLNIYLDLGDKLKDLLIKELCSDWELKNSVEVVHIPEIYYSDIVHKYKVYDRSHSIKKRKNGKFYTGLFGGEILDEIKDIRELSLYNLLNLYFALNPNMKRDELKEELEKKAEEMNK